MQSTLGFHGFMGDPLNRVLINGLIHAITLVEFGGKTINASSFPLILQIV